MAQDEKDKTTRLQSLGQDVIAMPRAGETAAGKSIPPAQDVFRVGAGTAAPAGPAPQPLPRPAAHAPAAAPAGNLLLVRLLLGAVVVLALAVTWLWAENAALGARAAGESEAAGQVAAELADARARLQKLEATMSTSAADTAALGVPAQASLLQMGAALRELRDDLDAVRNEVGKLSAQVGEARNAAAAAQRDVRAAQVQVDQAAARVGQLADQYAAQKPAAPAAAGGADVQAQLKAMGQKTDKMAGDIRQLYRLLESQSQ